MSSVDFASLGISAPVLKAVQQLGYEQPSPVQEASIPILLEGKNLLGTAQTGTGKTAAFALPFLSKLDEKQKTPQVLVLTPTRELAIQVAEAFQSYAKHIKGFHVLPIYGGADIGGQLRGLKRGAQVVVGTPGRMLDHLRRRSLDLSQIKGLILDEADEMLRMGFIDDVETILAKTPPECQRTLFSATMPPAIKRVADKYLGDAEVVSIENKTKTVERIAQSHLMVKGHQKMDALTRILDVEQFDGMIIFVRTKSSTLEIAEKLEARGFSSAALNGDLTQTVRERTINRLKKGQLDIVVATDVAARGLDVERISHVINYDVPYDNESYVHRIGRTGRAGREGKAIMFVTQKETRMLRSIEKSTRQPISSFNLPSNEEVSGQRVEQFKEQLVGMCKSTKLDKFHSLVKEVAAEHDIDMTLLAAALAFEAQKERPLFPKMVAIDTPRASNKDRSNDRKPRERNERNDRSDRSERQRPDRAPKAARDKAPMTDNEGNDVAMITYRIEVGRNDDVSPKNIVGAIANEAQIDAQFIGHIKLHDNHSTVDLPEGMPKELFDHLYKVRVCQKPLKISVDNGTAGEQRDAKPAFKGKRDKPAFKGKPKAHRGSDSEPRKPRKRPATDR
ncbi:ATP-dependent RNA helicase DeaD [marine gamma proteobacterium HTCC2207]|jgi:ATP-dependent RNA helicase DeaD|uniref:ATP-dependent RNA helicase DeaD n=1 Tax=gamma proteobacterium HTCC2207 TaxID=314287 RepID=Q1YS94_9GAMM|nr:ATP-dependent RNA helicase DeaD [marine gamma proteobacterium HTCC2207] [gamma proteobacterium HTCC2207]MBT5104682.1 DEAD/DEAH box helicase [Porticoccaceae bacterium]